ncbi:gliding motility protein GldC [Ichthyobacterium seriolicida]|uniref:Gliding motility protein GldC n=1 Tax=Ichthyobacterium seriolicida TaxID=242600 RepID=A0A1J1EBQ1_9FLAO|nr:gliding motility protein GldC [Ichthyobacterium seriolicida]BAV94936.1 gliding motility protein GldC [Ichthyobacterium seriolicida]
MTKSQINIDLELDENKIPKSIKWTSSDGQADSVNVESLILSFWDKKNEETLRIDLWTKDMLVNDMKKFYHQTLLSMADSYERATSDNKMASSLRDFCDFFAEKTNIK